MAPIFSLAGWALFGAGVRAYQVGLKQQPWGLKPLSYVYSAAFWAGVGVVFYGFKDRQEALLEKRVAALLDARAKRQVEAAE